MLCLIILDIEHLMIHWYPTILTAQGSVKDYNVLPILHTRCMLAPGSTSSNFIVSKCIKKYAEMAACNSPVKHTYINYTYIKGNFKTRIHIVCSRLPYSHPWLRDDNSRERTRIHEIQVYLHRDHPLHIFL